MQQIDIKEILHESDYRWDPLITSVLYLLLGTYLFSFIITFLPKIAVIYPWIIISIAIWCIIRKIRASPESLPRVFSFLKNFGDFKNSKSFRNFRNNLSAYFAEWDILSVIIICLGIIARIRIYDEFTDLNLGFDASAYLEYSSKIIDGDFWVASNWTLKHYAPLVFINFAIPQMLWGLDPLNAAKIFNFTLWLLTLPALYNILKKVLKKRTHLRIGLAFYMFFRPFYEHSVQVSSAISTAAITLIFFHFLLEHKFDKAAIASLFGFLTQYTLGLLFLVFILYILMHLSKFLYFGKDPLIKFIRNIIIKTILYGFLVIGPFLAFNLKIFNAPFYTADISYLFKPYPDRLQLCLDEFSYPYNLGRKTPITAHLPVVLIMIIISIIYTIVSSIISSVKRSKIAMNEKELNIYKEPLEELDVLAMEILLAAYIIFFFLFSPFFCMIRIMIPILFIVPISSFVYKNKKIILLMEWYWYFYIFDLIVFD